LPDEVYQSYFAEPPFTVENGKPYCEMFWGDAAQQLFIMLKEITSGKRKTNTKEVAKKRKGNTKKQ
jgi:hypothetical protein